MRIRRISLLMLLALAPVCVGAYEISFNAEGLRGYAPATFLYPINARMFALDVYGARIGYYNASARNPTVFESVSTNRQFGGRVLSDGDVELKFNAAGPVTGRFKSGRLVSLRRDGDAAAEEKDRQLFGARASRDRVLSALRKRPDHSKAGERYWRHSGRFRLWYNNPNAAGALFAEIVLLALSLAIVCKPRALKAAGVVVLLAAAVGLLATGSRGGMVAVAIGLAVMAVVPLVRCKRRRGVAIALVLSMAGLAAMLAFFGGRAIIRHDGSSSERIKIWKDAPRMMVAAPDGWKGPTGFAWCEWYQPQDDDFRTKWMVNSHLSRLVKYGTAMRFCYLFVWTFFLLFLCVYACKTGKTAALAQWTCFAVAMWFSTVGHVPSLWIVPAIPLASMLVAAARDQNWLTERGRLLRVGLTIAVVAAVLSAGGLWGILQVGHSLEAEQTSKNLVQRKTHGVQVGYGEPRVFLVHDDLVLTGSYVGAFGKEIRAYYQEHPDAPAMFIADGLEYLPEEMDVLALAGTVADAYLAHSGKARAKARRTFLISPETNWTDVPSDLRNASDVQYLSGEFVLQALKKPRGKCPAWVVGFPGAALYPPDWLDRILTIQP